jgi:hypothetical protein
MKHISYYLIRNKTIHKLIEDNEVLVSLDDDLGFGYEAVKIEVWPVDIKISPCHRLPNHGKRKPKTIPIERPYVPATVFEKRPNQKTIFRIDKES